MKRVAKRRGQRFRLRGADRRKLKQVMSRGAMPARVYKRARALQLLDEGRLGTEIQMAVGSSPQTFEECGSGTCWKV